MSSSFTTRKRLEKQNPGENSNTWGAFLNANMIDLVDEVFGIASVNFGTTAGDITLSQQNGSTDEGRRTILTLIGAPTSNVRLFVPAVQSPYIIRNKMTGTKKITITPAGGNTGVGFQTGENGLIVSDGTRCIEIFRTASAGTFNGVPSGAIFPFKGSVGGIPSGYFLCDGNNGTPDMSEKFVLGTVSNGGIDRVGTGLNITVVSANVSINTSVRPTTLTSAMIPAHAHYTFIDDLGAGGSANRYNLGTVAANAKNFTDLGGLGDGNYQMSGIVTNASPSIGQTSWAYASSPTGHSHLLEFEAGHKHTLTVTDGRPPFYSLLYIMKS